MGPLPRRGARIASLVLLAGATFAAFAGVLRNGWILFDDPRYVYENVHVMRGLRLEGLRWFLVHPHGGNWHPLTSCSHMLDVQLFGLDPRGHHAMSLALHALNAVLLALVLARFTGAWWRSVLVAALFALHPLRVESVAWISERKDVLSGLFFLLTLEAYRRWVARPGAARGALVAAALALGLMTKPMLVTLPIVLVLLDVWPLGRLAGEGRRPAATPRGTRAGAAPPAAPGRGPAPARPLWGLVREKWLLFALAAASAVVTFVVQRRTGAVASIGQIPAGRRLGNALVSCVLYVRDTLWPAGLAPFYPYPGAPQVAVAAACAAGLALATWGVLRVRRGRPYLAVGWLWFVVMLLPVIGLIQVGGQSHADRYTYLPTMGLLIALVWAAAELAGPARARRGALTGLALVVLTALGLATARQVARWRDTRTLFAYTLSVTRDNPIAHEYLGDVLLKEGRLADALPEYRDAVRFAPELADAHGEMGTALAALGRYDEALAEFRIALGLAETAETHHNLGFTYQRQGRIDDAVREFEAALALDPDLRLALVHLGAIQAARGRYAESEQHLRHALELAPGDLENQRLLAVTLTLEGRVEEAVAMYREILARRPDDLDALNNVAWIRATHAQAAHRDGAEAVRLAERARDASPEPVAVLYSTLAAAYAEAGRFADAVRAGQRAVALADSAGAPEESARYAAQLAVYRAGKAFHFAE